jgi:RNA recognition motif-containing protein
MNIYVSNLAFTATEENISELFTSFGEVEKVTLLKDKFTGRSRGTAFVEMPSSDDANQAINSLNQKEFMGRALVVNEARPKTDNKTFKPRSNFSGGSGGSGGSNQRRY